MKLIVDSGSTKAAWALCQDGQIISEIQTSGISPYFLDDTAIAHIARGALDFFDLSHLKGLFYYGTGCQASEQKQRLHRIFSILLPQSASIAVHTDIEGAARSTCQHQAGITGILGTGSNACRFDGHTVIQTAGGLGFILGDEGSGAAIGRELLIAFLNAELPTDLADVLQHTYSLQRDSILEAVYKKPFPSRYLAGFMPFMHTYRTEPAIHTLLNRQFDLFFQRNISPLQTEPSLPVHLVGSVAFYFQEALAESARAQNLFLSSIVQSPLQGMARYHP